jgi:hypothetical protein
MELVDKSSIMQHSSMHTVMWHGNNKSLAQVPQIPGENSDGNILLKTELRVSILPFQAQQQGVRL